MLSCILKMAADEHSKAKGCRTNKKTKYSDFNLNKRINLFTQENHLTMQPSSTSHSKRKKEFVIS